MVIIETKQISTASVGNGLDQRVKVAESTWHALVTTQPAVLDTLTGNTMNLFRPSRVRS